MADTLKYQIRLYLTDEFAAVARADARDPSLKAVNDVLDQYGLKMVNQYDALVGFCEEAEANNDTDNGLYRWTKDLVGQERAQAYKKHFTLYALNNDQVYDQAIADGVEAELLPLVGQGIIGKVSKYNNDPAQNPQAPERFQNKPEAPDAPEI